MTDVLEPELADDVPVRPRPTPSRADNAFRVTATVAAFASLIIVLLTLFYLVKGSRKAFVHSGIWGFFTTTTWQPAVGKFGALGLIEGTVVIALVALVVAIPLGIGMALFINEYAPARIKSIITSVIDLLAALPSIVFGMWGLFAFRGKLVKIATFLGSHLSVLPFLRLPGKQPLLVGSAFDAGMVVGVMALPIITSVSRDVMAQCPRDQCEAALALGGTRWGMIRAVILPFGRNGIVGACLLGFGRALGETIAVALIITQVFTFNSHILTSNAASIAAAIANRFNEATPVERSGLVAAGLALFLLTLLVNLIARFVVSSSGRRR